MDSGSLTRDGLPYVGRMEPYGTVLVDLYFTLQRRGFVLVV